MWLVMIESGPNFAHATTAYLSWHAQTYDQIGSVDLALQLKEFFQKFSIMSSWTDYEMSNWCQSKILSVMTSLTMIMADTKELFFS